MTTHTTVVHRLPSQNVNWPSVFARELCCISIVNTGHCTAFLKKFIKLSSAIFAFSCNIVGVSTPSLRSLFLSPRSRTLSSIWPVAQGSSRDSSITTDISRFLCLSLSLFTEVTYFALLRSSVTLWQMPELLSQLQPGAFSSLSQWSHTGVGNCAIWSHRPTCGQWVGPKEEYRTPAWTCPLRRIRKITIDRLLHCSLF